MFKESFNNVMITLSYEEKLDKTLRDNQLKCGAELLSNLKVYPLVGYFIFIFNGNVKFFIKFKSFF